MMKFEVLNIKNLTEADFAAAFEGMSPERKARCLRYKFAEDRRRMAFGEMLLKSLVGDKNLRLENLPSGKPVAFVGHREVFVSISHSGDFVAAAFAGTPVGIDLEVKREVNPNLLKRALTPAELEFVKTDEDFLKIWTAKEAYLKLTGEGLSGLMGADVLPLMQKGEKDGLILQEHHTRDYACTIIFKKI